MLKLTTVPVIPLALSEAMNAATLAISASVEQRVIRAGDQVPEAVCRFGLG